MIVGIDHVALSCEDVHAAGGELEGAGFEIKFTQEGVVNDERKRPLLREYERLHSIAFCQPRSGVALELTQHRAPLVVAPSPYQVLLSSPLPKSAPAEAGDPAWAPVWREALGCRQPEAAHCSTLRAQFWYDAWPRETGPPFVRALLVPAGDLERAERFWRGGLGCSPVARGAADGRRWSRLSRNAPVPHWSLDVILAEGESARPAPLLDDAGFTCLALLSTNLGTDAERLCRAGGRSEAGEFQIEVNNKTLGVTILRGPCGELIELIAVRTAGR